MVRALALEPDDDNDIDFDLLPRLLGYQLRRAQLAVFQNFARHLQGYDITPTQFAVMVLIQANNGLSQRALSAAVGTDQSSLVSLLDRLQSRGWVERHRSERDRRFHVLSLSGEGRKQLAEIKQLVQRQDEELGTVLATEERKKLMQLLQRLLGPRDAGV